MRIFIVIDIIENLQLKVFISFNEKKEKGRGNLTNLQIKNNKDI